jgi:hypothetical protein
MARRFGGASGARFGGTRIIESIEEPAPPSSGLSSTSAALPRLGAGGVIIW